MSGGVPLGYSFQPQRMIFPSPLMVPASVIKFSVFRSFGAMEGMVL